MTQPKNKIQEKAKFFEEFLSRYNNSRTMEWNFDPMISLDDMKIVSLFDPNLNTLLKSYYLEHTTMFYSFYSNRFNPTEKTLLITYFEILEKLVYKDYIIYIVNFLNKPRLLLQNTLFTINNDTVYVPDLYRNLVLVDANMVDSRSDVQLLSKININLKEYLLKNLGKLSLLYFWEKLIGLDGLAAKYIYGLLDNEMKNALDNLKWTNVLSHFWQASNKDTCQKKVQFDYFLEKFMELKIQFKYSFTNTEIVVEKEKRDLLLTPVVNELYLKISQEYFQDSEWPFISPELNVHIKKTNSTIVNEVREATAQ